MTDQNDCTKLSSNPILMLERSEEKFNMLFEFSPIGMALVDHETGVFLEVNRSLLQSTGYTKEEFVSLSYWDITPREYEAQEMKQIEDLNTKGSFGPNEKEYIRKDGSRYPIRIQGFIMDDVHGKKLVWGILEDISELKRMETELKSQAMNDYLTGIYNRRFFNEVLNQAIANAERMTQNLSIIVFDIDHFKSINDTYGHNKGDETLVNLTSFVKANIRACDVFCRWGGDEFILMIPGADLENARIVAEKLKLIISQGDFSLPTKVTCSFGVSTRSEKQIGLDLINLADKALYNAKQKGRNCVETSHQCSK